MHDGPFHFTYGCLSHIQHARQQRLQRFSAATMQAHRPNRYNIVRLLLPCRIGSLLLMSLNARRLPLRLIEALVRSSVIRR
jgi:hypothetical protein